MRFDIDPNPSKSCKRSLGEASSHEVILLFKQVRNFGDYLYSKTHQAKGKIWSAALANTPKNHVKMQHYRSSDKAMSSNQSYKFNLLTDILHNQNNGGILWSKRDPKIQYFLDHVIST